MQGYYGRKVNYSYLYHCSLNYTVVCYRFSSHFISSLAKKLRKCAFTALFKVTLRPPCKHDNARFITVPSQLSLIMYELYMNVYHFKNTKLRISTITQDNYLPNSRSDKGFKGTVVNRSLPS